MKREDVIKIINDDPHLTIEQGAAILERMKDCETHLNEEFNALIKEHKGCINPILNKMFKVCFFHGYVYASLELNGEAKL